MHTKSKTMHDLHTYGLIGMLIILSASLLPTNAEDAHAASEEYYPEDYDYGDNPMTANTSANTQGEASSPNSSPPLISMATLMSLPNKFEIPSRTNYVREPVCPTACECFDDFKSIDCSGRQLTELPKDLPSSVHTLNLSANNIDALPEQAFRNLRKLQTINLSHNRLRTLSKEVFTELTSLESLHLENNAFDHIPADAFSNAVNLKELHLSNNALSPQQNSSFLEHTQLRQLHCNNCSWLSLHDSIFANLTGLEILMLDENPFKEINIRAFAPLKNLIKLALPTAQESSLTELCQLLKSIDNISFDNYTLSCYELVLGTAFNDSIKITRHEAADSGQTTELKMNVTASWYNSTVVDPTNATNTLVIETTGNDTDISTATGKAITSSSGGGGGDDGGESTYQVPVSQEVINIMLISIMIIAVIGILIGIVCRKDVFGIKTKCCRTKKPKPEDAQQPAEEILLNKLA